MKNIRKKPLTSESIGQLTLAGDSRVMRIENCDKVLTASSNSKSLESWIWEAACSIRGAQEAPKYKDFILPLIFTKRLCDVFDDELERIAEKVGSRSKAFKLVTRDQNLVRFYLPLRPENPDDPVWSVIRKLSDKIGEQLTSYLREVAKTNPLLQGIIDRIDFNATTHGQRDIDDNRLSNLIEKISEKRLGLDDVEPDIIGRSYEYLIRKFAEGSGQSAGEFYTPKEVGMIMARLMDPEPGMTIYDPCCGSAGLLIKCQIVLHEKMAEAKIENYSPLQLLGQEFMGNTWAMANMNMIIHDMEGHIEIGDTFRNPKFREGEGGRLQTFHRVVANPMWSQKDFKPVDYDNDTLGRFPTGAGYPGSRADWGWMQHILASMGENAKGAVILGTGAASRGSGDDERDNKEKTVRQWFVNHDVLDSVILLPENLFYNTPNAGLIFLLKKLKSRPGEVLMIDVSEEFDRGRAKNTLSQKGLGLICEAYSQWKEIPGISAVATTREISSPENDFNLLPNRYIRRPIPQNWEQDIFRQFESATNEFERKLVFDFLARFLQALKQQSKVTSELELATVTEGWERRRLGDLLTNSAMTFVDRESDENPVVLSLTKDDGLIVQSDRFDHSVAIDDLSSYKLVRRSWLVYNPMVIWEGAIHVLYDYSCGVVSPAYEVWRPNGIDYRYLDYIVKTPLVIDEYRRLSSGGVKRRRIVSVRDFCSIEVPVPCGKVKEELAKSLDEISRGLEISIEGVVNTTLARLG